MSAIRIAIIGPTCSGATALAMHLHEYVKETRTFRDATLYLADLGSQIPPDLWRSYDFVIVTFELTGGRDAFQSAWTLVCTALSHDPDHRVERLVMAGTKWDLIPSDPYDTAVMVYDHAREAEYRQPGLKMFPVSSLAATGYSELSSHIANVLRKSPQSGPLVPALHLCLRRLGAWALDCLAGALALPVPKNVNQSTPDPYELDDATIATLRKSPTARAWDEAISKYATGFSKTSPCHKITPELVVKWLNPVEYATMVYVRSHTRIPVPQPRYPQLTSWLVMDLVDGRMLLECWESLSWWMKLRVACTLRGYIRQLRALKGTRPGSVVDGMIKEHSLFNDRLFGPFKDAEEFRAWCEHVAHLGWVSYTRYRRSPAYEGPSDAEDPCPYPIMGEKWPLVFTHGDLNLSNMMLSADGVLWIVDWATGGFFPPWLETIGLRHCEPPASFERYIGFISGPFPEYEYFWSFFKEAVYRVRASKAM